MAPFPARFRAQAGRGLLRGALGLGSVMVSEPLLWVRRVHVRPRPTPPDLRRRRRVEEAEPLLRRTAEGDLTPERDARARRPLVPVRRRSGPGPFRRRESLADRRL